MTSIWVIKRSLGRSWEVYKDDCYAACFSIGSLPDYLKEKAELISKAGEVCGNATWSSDQLYRDFFQAIIRIPINQSV